MRKRRVPGWVAAAVAGCVVGAGAALAAPALAVAPSTPTAPATPLAPEYRLVTADGSFGAVARCPNGFTVTGGGHAGASSVNLLAASRPLDDLSGWQVAGGVERERAYAVCVSRG